MKHEQTDILLNSMMVKVLTLLKDRHLEKGIHLFTKYREAGFLVSSNEQTWTKPGSYYQAHKKIERPDAKPEAVLGERRGDLITRARALGLDDVVKELSALDYSTLKVLPKGVYRMNDSLGKTVEVEVQQETEAETEVNTQVETEDILEVEEMPYYLPWQNVRNNYDQTPNKYYQLHSATKMLHPAFDKELRFTENFLPLYRKEWANRIHHRELNDTRQKPLNYIRIKFEKGELHVIMSDMFDASYIPGSTTSAQDDIRARQDQERKEQADFYGKWGREEPAYPDPYYGEYLYHVGLRHTINPFDNRITPTTQIKINRAILQARFATGQYNGYTEEDKKILVEWFREQADPFALKKFFIEVILKYRPEDRKKFETSELNTLFEQSLKGKVARK